MPINGLLLKTRNNKASDWREHFDRSLLRFPGGLLDWGAFGLLVGIVAICVSIILAGWNVNVFRSSTLFAVFFTVITTVVYYWIYYQRIELLKKRIGKHRENRD